MNTVCTRTASGHTQQTAGRRWIREERHLYIGELAKLSGCTPKAIRLYEQSGLLSPQRHGSYGLPQGTDSSAGVMSIEGDSTGPGTSKIIGFVKSNHPCIDLNRVNP
ncbi:MerR family DNA-binding transcriptional regulator [Pseudomonas sp. S2_G10]